MKNISQNNVQLELNCNFDAPFILVTIKPNMKGKSKKEK